MKQTAVEWLVEEYFGGMENCTPDFRYHIEQAKEMEKQQIIKARATARRLGALGGAHYLSEADKYYNETFKSE